MSDEAGPSTSFEGEEDAMEVMMDPSLLLADQDMTEGGDESEGDAKGQFSRGSDVASWNFFLCLATTADCALVTYSR